MSISWKASLPIIARGTCPVIATSGIESSQRRRRPSADWSPQAPEVPKHTAGRPVARAIPCAMKPAPCSWRASTWRMQLARSASCNGRLAPMPAMMSMPWRSTAW
ncbi:MAG: hypothetical protein U0802_21245 [Candidatus Binatia bacterium]